MVLAIEKSSAATRLLLETKSFRACISVKLNRAFAMIIRHTYRCVSACACVHACTRACMCAGMLCRKRSFACNGPVFYFYCANHARRRAHGWKRSTLVNCVLAYSVHLNCRTSLCTIDPTTPLRSSCVCRVAFANVVNNPRNRMRRFSLWTTELAECSNVAPGYIAVVSIQRAK